MKTLLVLTSILALVFPVMAENDSPRVSTPASTASSKPNILFAIADDWSYGHAGAYGCKWIKTPAMDRVAREGILFNNAYTPNGKCSPSRASIITGRNPWQLKEAGNHWSVFPAEFKSFQESLGEHGYFAGMTGKGWGPGIAKDAAGKNREMAGKPFSARKFPSRITKGISPADYAGNFNDFLDAAPKDQPWSFWYGGHEPHRGYEYGSGVAKGGRKTSDIDRVPACWPDTEQVRNDMLDYAFEVENYDLHLSRMLEELEKRGMLENTIVVVTSDNGMPFPHCKGYAYNNSDHLPLAIMWPKGIAKPGRVVDDYVSFIDFAPTFLEVAGVTQRESGMAPTTGRSLTEIFKSDKSGRVIPERDHVLLAKERNDVGRPNDEGYPIRGIVKNGMLYLHNFQPDRGPGGVAETGYKDTDESPTKTAVLETEKKPDLKHFFDASFGKLPADQLFDLRSDPDCMNNLAATMSFAELQKQLFAELKQQGDPRMLENGHIYDEYPYGFAEKRNFYDRIMRGEKIEAAKEE
ncbi:MAG: sulfatase [Akkermansiaceae bacterium]|nr:sulfatase [Akkermansiaceae bacterium]